MPSLNTERHLVVHVGDVNDNAPVLSRHHYTVSVPENTPVGTSVFHLEASDNDIGTNARLVYCLTTLSATPRVLDVDPHSGDVFVVERLDFENSVAQLEYEVHVRDGGSPSLSAAGRLTVIIVDVDDCPSRFTQSVYVFDVLENCQSGSPVGTVSASDGDSWPFAVVRSGRNSLYTDNGDRLLSQTRSLMTTTVQ